MPALVVAVACGGGTSPPVANRSGQPAVAEAPDRDGFVELLKTHADHSLAAGSENGCPADETIGVWTGRLLDNGMPKDDGGRHELTGGCGRYDARKMPYLDPASPADEETHWYCRLDAYASDPAGESPWSCGLFVRVRKVDRAVDWDSLVCPGTC